MTDSTTRIEEDLRITRARMDGRLTELQERLTPGQILDDVMAYFRDNGGSDFGRNLVTSVRSNPLPAAITGIGLAWLMASGSGVTAGSGSDIRRQASPGVASQRTSWSERSQDDLDLRLSNAEKGVARSANESEEAWRNRIDAARGGIVGVAREAGETAESFGHRIAEAIGKAKQSVMEKVHDMQDQAADAGGRVGAIAQQAGDSVAEGSRRAKAAGSKIMATMGDNPLLLGAVALGFGALLGALIPQSEQEEAALGDAAAKIRAAAATAAQGVMDRGSEIADHVLAAGQKSAGAHGLSGDMSVGELIAGVRSGELLDQVEGTARDALQATEASQDDGQKPAVRQGQPS